MEGFGDLLRMVNRSDGTVSAVLVNGRVAFEDGHFDAALGVERGFGQFLGAGEKSAAGTIGAGARVSRAAEAA